MNNNSYLARLLGESQSTVICSKSLTNVCLVSLNTWLSIVFKSKGTGSDWDTSEKEALYVCLSEKY